MNDEKKSVWHREVLSRWSFCAGFLLLLAAWLLAAFFYREGDASANRSIIWLGTACALLVAFNAMVFYRLLKLESGQRN